MELAEFITKTLVEITQGLKDANKQLQVQGVSAEYAMPTYSSGLVKDGAIHFDVAVSVSEENSVKGGGGIKVAIMNMGAEKEGVGKHESFSRIKFSIVPTKMIN